MTAGSPHAYWPWNADSLGTRPYPVVVDGAFDPAPSRWLWLVKWLLAVPHYVVLAFLWIGVVAATAIAFFAVLFTGRYPGALFHFNAGVMRWTWRVTYYVLPVGFDRYPRFSLAMWRDDPATLDVRRPEALSRPLVLVKWVLAIPQFIVTRIVTMLAIALAIIGGVILLVTGRNPADIHELVVGAMRWNYRVTAYALLMRDDYPPFRFGR